MKKVQNKLAVIVIAIGIILISLIGFGYVQVISKMNSVTDVINVTWKFVVLAIIVFTLIIIVFKSIFVKVIEKSMVDIVKNAGKIVTGSNKEIKLLQEGNKSKYEFMNAFDDATLELREHLKDVDKQKNQIETILLYMTDGVIAFDLEGQITHKNLAADRLLNLKGDETDFDQVFSKFDVDFNMEKIIYLEDWTSSDKKLQVEDKYINLFFVPYKDHNKRAAGIIVVIQDITEQVDLDNMRKEFVADVSHELKTPITSIMGYADTLLEGDYDKETQKKFLNVISTEARRMAKLVTDLLTLSRYDNDEIKTKKTEFDLGDLVKQCQEKLQIEIHKKNHNAECFVTANVPLVYADRDGVERVVLNILSNSIKYTPENGTIKMYVGYIYNDAYIKVIDNGLGIPEDDLDRIYDRFYRVDKSRTREMGGTGLGLSIAKEILDKNNGSIDIKSKKDEGTEVVIRIPIKK